jgi:hypothetical protein
MAQAQSERQVLAERFEGMAADGLVDVKFYLRNLREAATEQVCREVNSLYAALDRGDCARLDFKDSHK